MENKNNKSPIIPPCAPCCKSLNGVLVFGLGVLIGAVISTASFLITVNVLGSGNSSSDQTSQMQGGGTPPDMPSGDNSQGGTPPDMPNNSSSENNN
jgi:hypothetical protein